MNKEIEEKIKIIAEEYFDGNKQKAIDFLILYALEKLGHLKPPTNKTERRITFGKLESTLEAFVFEYADKVYNGVFTRAIYELLDIALKQRFGQEIDLNKLISAKVKSDTDPLKFHRSLRRRRENTFSLSITEKDADIVERFMKFYLENDMDRNEAFNILIREVYELYKSL